MKLRRFYKQLCQLFISSVIHALPQKLNALIPEQLTPEAMRGEGGHMIIIVCLTFILFLYLPEVSLEGTFVAKSRLHVIHPTI